MGIEFLHFTIKPYYKLRIPLEVIFKIFHSNEHIPLIKYNPGKRFENIFRLYTNGYVATNIKIPLFMWRNKKKRKIIEISRAIAKINQ